MSASTMYDELESTLDGDEAVVYYAYADVPGTTLSVIFAEDASANDVARIGEILADEDYHIDGLARGEIHVAASYKVTA